MFTTIRNRDHDRLKAEAERFNQKLADFMPILVAGWRSLPEKRQLAIVREYARTKRSHDGDGDCADGN